MIRTLKCPTCGALHAREDGAAPGSVYHDVLLLEPCPACDPAYHVSMVRVRGWAGDRRDRDGEKIR